jgi:four helix bundle protein
MDSAAEIDVPKSHTELICWQLADQLRQLILANTETGPVSKDYRFTSNLRDAISSVCRNQAEGFAKYWHKQERPYFNTAQGALAETSDGIIDGLERGYFTPELASDMQRLCKRATKANLKWLKSLDRPDPA